MKKSVAIFILLVMCQGLLLGQTEILRSYEISEFDFPQKLVLIEYENGNYEGYFFTKISRTHEGKKEEITDKYDLVGLNVRDLMKDLKEGGIEEWKNCDQTANCGTIYFLKSRFFSFKIHTNNFKKQGYQEVINVDSDFMDRLWSKGHSIIRIIEKYVNFYTEFQEVFRRLPKGTYEWLSIKESSIGILNSKE